MARISVERLSTFDNDFLLTTDEVCTIDGIDVGPSTISKHRHAGLLPFVPGRPIRHRVGDVKVYHRMITNGVSKRLHKTLVIGYEDRAVYSPLNSLQSFTESGVKQTIEAVIAETDALWKKYKMAKDADKKAANEQKRRKAA